MEKFKIIEDEQGNEVVVILSAIFKNKQNIDWTEVQKFLAKYIGIKLKVEEDGEYIFVGKNFPDEYAYSDYTKKLRGGRAKAKANAAQGIKGLVKFASNRRNRENKKDKHSKEAKEGWFYYDVRFAIPKYENENITENYNVYTGRLVINSPHIGKKYLYDLVDIKKEASKPLKTI